MGIGMDSYFTYKYGGVGNPYNPNVGMPQQPNQGDQMASYSDYSYGNNGPYADILKGYKDREGAGTGAFDSLLASRTGDINNAFAGQATQVDQKMNDSGLGNTTVGSGLKAGLAGQQQAALTQAQGEIGAQKAKYASDLSGDTLKFMERYGMGGAGRTSGVGGGTGLGGNGGLDAFGAYNPSTGLVSQAGYTHGAGPQHSAGVGFDPKLQESKGGPYTARGAAEFGQSQAGMAQAKQAALLARAAKNPYWDQDWGA